MAIMSMRISGAMWIILTQYDYGADDMSFSLRPLEASDYAALVSLWTSAGWIDVRQTDTPEALAKFLHRNPSCNFGVYEGDHLVGAVLAGHDGWRGYLYHMAVAPEFWGMGIGRQLVLAATETILHEGIPKVHCLVKRENTDAQRFWESCGFVLRDELLDYSYG
jgi:ribosomal protein S18 acetylase RimI-like enzyme